MVTNDCFPYFSFQLSNGVTLIGTPSENWARLVMRRTLLLSIASCQCLIYRRVVWSPAISSWQNRQKIMLYYWAVTTPPCLQTSAKDLKLKYVDQYNSSLLCHSFINSSSTKNLLAHYFVHSLWAEMLMTCCWCMSLKHVNVFWLVWSVYKPFNLHISCGFLFIGLKGAYRLVSSPTLTPINCSIHFKASLRGSEGAERECKYWNYAKMARRYDLLPNNQNLLVFLLLCSHITTRTTNGSLCANLLHLWQLVMFSLCVMKHGMLHVRTS